MAVDKRVNVIQNFDRKTPKTSSDFPISEKLNDKRTAVKISMWKDVKIMAVAKFNSGYVDETAEL